MVCIQLGVVFRVNIGVYYHSIAVLLGGGRQMPCFQSGIAVSYSDRVATTRPFERPLKLGYTTTRTEEYEKVATTRPFERPLKPSGMSALKSRTNVATTRPFERPLKPSSYRVSVSFGRFVATTRPFERPLKPILPLPALGFCVGCNYSAV